MARAAYIQFYLQEGGRGNRYMQLLNNIFKLTHYIVKSIDSLLSSQSEEFMKIYLPYSQWNIVIVFFHIRAQNVLERLGIYGIAMNANYAKKEFLKR